MTEVLSKICRAIWPEFSSILARLAFMVILSFFAMTTTFAAEGSEDSEGYEVSRHGNKLIIKFRQQLAFDEVHLPAISEELWGRGNLCRAALLEASNQQYISAAQKDKNPIIFRPDAIASSSLLITPLIVVKHDGETGNETSSPLIKIIAVPAAYRHLEHRLAKLASKVSDFQQKNRCFSCHTALPLAMTFQAAANRGLHIDQDAILQVGREIAGLQQSDGSYFFSQEPAYGTIMTTLCAGATMALISDFSAEFTMNLIKIMPLLKDWQNRDGITDSDFFFRPFFVGQPTAAALEAIIINNLHCAAAQNHERQQNIDLHRRLQQLQKWAESQKKEAVHRRIVIMAATPLLFQFKHSERDFIVRELTDIIKNEPEGKRRDVRALIFSLLERLAPELDLQLPDLPQPQNIADEIWDCHEKIKQLPFPVR